MPFHPYRRPICALLLSLAFVAYFISIKNSSREGTELFVPENETGSFDDYFESNATENADLFQQGQYFEQKIENDSRPIHILGLFELSTKYRSKSEGESEVAAAKLAIERINGLDVLPGYRLELLVNDTMGDPGVATDRFFHAIYSKKTIIMLLGSGYSNVTERLAHVVPYWNVLQVSFGSKSPTLSDRRKFPLFFRTVAPDSSHNTAKIRFVEHFKWKTVATFSQSGNSYLLPVNKLVKEFERINVLCRSAITFSPDNYKEQLQILKASEIGMHGSDYVWILQGQEDVWWHNQKDCSDTQLERSTDGILMVFDYSDASTRKNVFILGNETLDSYVLGPGKISKYVRQTYDAVWSMALTLRESMTWMAPLEDFRYTRKDMVCRFISEMGNLRFIGISGPVKFSGADRIGNSIIRQFQDGKLVDIAIFDSIENTLNFDCETCQKISWKDNHIPIAQRILKIDLITIPKTIFYVVLVVSAMGIAASALFLYFNLHFRRMKTVKISSPKLNNVAVLGCMLVYVSVILFALNNGPVRVGYFKELCTVRVYLLSAGFSLAFGSMLAKAYRVHRLFAYNIPSLVKDKLLMDKQLIALILIPLLIDGMICGLWVFMDPMERRLQNLSLRISPTNRGVVCQPQVETCRSDNTLGWYIALFGYKGIILIMGLYMAWKTRHIKVPALNDSQYIGICVYSAVFCAIIVALSALISERFIVSYLARTISILAVTTIALLLLFLSKIRCVFGKVDTGDSIMQSMGLKVEYNTRRFILNDHRELIYRLEVRNKVYKAELENLEREIFKLEEQLFQASTSSTKSSVNVIETTADCHYLNVPVVTGRGSWPTAHHQTKISKNEFHSENKLNETFFEKFNLLGKLKKIFNSISSLQLQNSTQEDWFKLPKIEKRKIGSNPEFYSQLLVPIAHLNKVNSEIHIRSSN